MSEDCQKKPESTSRFAKNPLVPVTEIGANCIFADAACTGLYMILQGKTCIPIELTIDGERTGLKCTGESVELDSISADNVRMVGFFANGIFYIQPPAPPGQSDRVCRLRRLIG